MTDKIRTAIEDFVTRTGQPPTSLYLGRDDLSRFVGENKQEFFGSGRINGTRRMMIFGLFVYKLDAEHHIACS